MAHYQVILAYDGTQFEGFQRQPHRGVISPGTRTVQGVVEQALYQLGWQGRSILAAGRTDAGVHATGQVISFDLDWKHPLQELRSALNANLPFDVAVQSVQPAQPGFHPRYNAIARRYAYRLFCQEVRNPLRERYAWRVWPAVELERLNQAAAYLIGEHDFAAFGAPLRVHGSTVRSVYQAAWRCEPASFTGEELVFDVQANAFLYRMVRCLVAFQVTIGQGRLEPEEVGFNVAGKPMEWVQGLAPPQGLCLVKVDYPAEISDIT